MFLLYHAYIYLELLILTCTIYILAPHWQICIDGMINDGYHCLKNVFEMKPEEFFERVNVYADTVNNGEYAVRWKKRMDIVHFPEL